MAHKVAAKNAHLTRKTQEAADKAARKRAHQEQREEALAEARREQERLERRIAREKEQPALGAAPGAQFGHLTPSIPEDELVEDQPTEPAPPPGKYDDIPWDGEGEGYSIGEARKMLMRGYNIRKVVSSTGVGRRWLDDIPLDALGFGGEPKS